MQLKTTEKSYKLFYPFETLFLYCINQCDSGSTGSVEVMFFSCVWQFVVQANVAPSKTTNVSISEQGRARSGAATVTPLPWTRLRERGQSASRAGRTHRLSWKAGDEGHRTDSAPPDRVTLPSQVSHWLRLDTPFKPFVCCSLLHTVMPVFSTFTPAIHSTKKKNKEMFAKSLIKLPFFWWWWWWGGVLCSVVF